MDVEEIQYIPKESKMPEIVHCSICGKAIKVKNFADQMEKIRHHRKLKHPYAFNKSIQKAKRTRKDK